MTSFKRTIKRVPAIVLLLLVAVLILLTSLLIVPPEPRCKGMTLTEWLTISDQNVGDGIAEIGPEAIPFLIRKIKTKDSLFGKNYRAIYPKIPTYIRGHFPNPYTSEEVERNALEALREFGEEAKSALPVVIEAARENNFTQSWAIRAALSIGWDTPQVKDLMEELLTDPSQQQQERAALGIYYTGYYPEDVAELLISDLSSQPPPFNGLRALGVMKPVAFPAFQIVTNAIRDPKWNANALTAIRRMGPVAASAVPLLIDQLDNSDGNSEVNVIEALLNIGPQAKDALPKLRPLMRDDDATVRILSAAAVAKISGDFQPSVPVMVDTMNSSVPSSSVWMSPIRKYGLDHYGFTKQDAAAWFLGEFAPASASALPELKSKLLDSPDWLTALIARAVWRLTHDADQVLPALKIALRGRYNGGRVFACLTLAEMGASAKLALPDLEAACKTSLNTRRAALHAIKVIQQAENDDGL